MRARGKNKVRAGIAGCTVLAIVWISGCDDAAKKPVHAAGNAPALVPAPAKQADSNPIQSLPLGKYRVPDVSLVPPVPGGINYLITVVQGKFASGEANFRAGHLSAARRDFDDSVDWILESGYDPNSDPQLSELFRVICFST